MSKSIAKSEFKTLIQHKHVLVLKPSPTRDGKEEWRSEANFMGNGMALCGVLKDGEELSDFIKRRNKNNIINKKKQNYE